MAIRYFNIKSKPNVFGFAIKVNTENPQNKTIESLSSNHYFNKIRENEKCSHFELFEGDYNIIGDTGYPVTLERGSEKSLLNICLDDLENIKLYQNKDKYLSKEISVKEAENIKEDAKNHRLIQS